MSLVFEHSTTTTRVLAKIPTGVSIAQDRMPELAGWGELLQREDKIWSNKANSTRRSSGPREATLLGGGRLLAQKNLGLLYSSMLAERRYVRLRMTPPCWFASSGS